MSYDVVSSCNRCGGENEVDPADWIDHTMTEANTECKKCGFKDYWTTGHFMSREDGYSKCEKY